jgi:hypothetical protein
MLSNLECKSERGSLTDLAGTVTKGGSAKNHGGERAGLLPALDDHAEMLADQPPSGNARSVR